MSSSPAATAELSIGEVSRRSGLAASALRHYEAEGLISAQRDVNGRRFYPRSVLRRLAFVRAAQAVGLSLVDISEALAHLPAERTPTNADWAVIARAWEDRLTEQIEALTALRDQLTSCIGCGCLSLTSCQLSNPGDVSGSYGSGAQYLPTVLRRPRRPLSG